MGIEQAWLVKGWLLAKDAPEPVIGAIEAVIAGLAARSQPDIGSTIPQPAPESPVPVRLFDRDPDQFITGQEPAVVPLSDPEPRKRKAWSPEARAAASERMRATQARLKEAKNTPPGNSPAPPPGGA